MYLYLFYEFSLLLQSTKQDILNLKIEGVQVKQIDDTVGHFLFTLPLQMSSRLFVKREMFDGSKRFRFNEVFLHFSCYLILIT